MLMECLIPREGETHLSVGTVPLVFAPNDLGHSICWVASEAVQQYLIATGFYRPYSRQNYEEPDIPPVNFEELPEADISARKEGRAVPEGGGEPGKLRSQFKMLNSKTFAGWVEGSLGKIPSMPAEIQAEIKEKWDKMYDSPYPVEG